jgi:hypothetical protein
MSLHILQIAWIGCCALWWKDEVVLTPDDQRRRLILLEEGMELWIERNVRPIAEEQV